jgi:hypothetical protein
LLVAEPEAELKVHLEILAHIVALAAHPQNIFTMTRNNNCRKLVLPAATTMAAAAAVLIAASTSTGTVAGVEAAISPFGVGSVPSVGRRAAWGTVENIPRGGSTGKTINFFPQLAAHMAHMKQPNLLQQNKKNYAAN